MWIHAIFNALRARVPKTVIIGDCFEHIQPNSAFLALEMAWFQLYAINGANFAA